MKLNNFDAPVLTDKIISCYWNNIIESIKENWNQNLSYMKWELSEYPHYIDGTVSDLPVYKYGGCWSKNNKIYINPEFRKTFMYYNGRLPKNKNEWDFSVNLIIGHEIGHEIFYKSSTKYKEYTLSIASKNNFTSPYLKSICETHKKFKEEMFCEFIGYNIHKKVGF